MSIKSLLLPAFSERLLSRERLLARRAGAERKRAARRARHEVHYFHQVDDPYSALTAAVLPRLVEAVYHGAAGSQDESVQQLADRVRLLAARILTSPGGEI